MEFFFIEACGPVIREKEYCYDERAKLYTSNPGNTRKTQSL